MGISVSQLKQAGHIKKVVIHSIDLSLYLVSVVVDQEEHYVTDNTGAPLKSHNLKELKSLLSQSNIGKAAMEQQSIHGKSIHGKNFYGKGRLDTRADRELA
ncbi:hypothetical protein FKG94_16370 [Exilibacterium tricleocarpae]|uniref:Uncharacterized protein n=1 Tax=Exilibacterium tricleocarpae TaxID=2591008 RepID=A0A545TAE1_9GAMM|nr:DUF6482 family protein [Exilibacterium tricleocarpae]TQV74181.1 hypothetical protein FKG94_16370 [Exilibacterium tricleocarpae]